MRSFLNSPNVRYIVFAIILWAMVGSLEHDWVINQPRYTAMGSTYRLNTVTGAIAICEPQPVGRGTAAVVCRDTAGL
jgi:hypothetical protein